MKKLLSILLIAVMIFSVVGCGKDKTDKKDDAAEEKKEEAADVATEDKAEDKVEDKAEDAEPASDGEKVKVAFICADMANESQAFSSREFEKYGPDYGFEVTVLDAKGMTQNESQLVNNCISQGMKAIFLNPNDINAIVPSVKDAQEAGIVVGLFSADLAEENHQYRSFFCGVDDTMAGEEVAKAFINNFPDGAKIVEIGGQSGHDAAIKRHDGFDKGIAGSNVEVLEFRSPTQWAADQAMTIMEDMITSYGDDIEGVFCHWDIGATGCIEALEAAGMMDDIFLVGVDGNKAGFGQVKAGLQDVTISQNFTNMAKKSMEVARAVIDGEDFEEFNFIPLDVITQDNIDEFPEPEW